MTTKTNTVKLSKVATAFDARPGTRRQKLLDAMANSRKPVATSVLLKSVYGSAKPENKGALKMSMRGAALTIKTKRLPFKIVKVKDEKTNELCFALQPKR